MDLSTYVDSIRRDLAAAAEVVSDEAKIAAERMTTALDSSVRLALLDALSEATAEITRDLAPGSVEVRIRGRGPEFVVTPPPVPDADFTPPAPPPPPSPPGLGDIDQSTSRITLRMPESLKAKVEQASAEQGISVNAWLVRAIGDAVNDPNAGRGTRGRRGPRIGKQFSGWVR